METFLALNEWLLGFSVAIAAVSNYLTIKKLRKRGAAWSFLLDGSFQRGTLGLCATNTSRSASSQRG